MIEDMDEEDISRMKKAFEQFVRQGFLEKLRNAGVLMDRFNFIVKTPLGKNKWVFGIKKIHYEILNKENKILVVAIENPIKRKKYNFYIYDIKNPEDAQFNSGYTDKFQFIHFKIIKELRGVDEYLQDLEKGEQLRL